MTMCVPRATPSQSNPLIRPSASSRPWTSPNFPVILSRSETTMATARPMERHDARGKPPTAGTQHRNALSFLQISFMQQPLDAGAHRHDEGGQFDRQFVRDGNEHGMSIQSDGIGVAAKVFKSRLLDDMPVARRLAKAPMSLAAILAISARTRIIDDHAPARMALQRVRRICPERIDDAHDFVPKGKRNVHHRTITMERLGIADATCAALHFEHSLIVA